MTCSRLKPSVKLPSPFGYGLANRIRHALRHLLVVEFAENELEELNSVNDIADDGEWSSLVFGNSSCGDACRLIATLAFDLLNMVYDVLTIHSYVCRSCARYIVFVVFVGFGVMKGIAMRVMTCSQPVLTQLEV